MSQNHQELLLNVLQAPHISEKSALVADKHRQFVFKVAKFATKPLVKDAVEKLFKVEVEAVRVNNVKGKTRRFRGMQGVGKSWKKAYVTLKEGHDIDFTGSNIEGEK